MKRARPKAHYRTIKTKKGKKRILVNKGIKGRMKRKRLKVSYSKIPMIVGGRYLGRDDPNDSLVYVDDHSFLVNKKGLIAQSINKNKFRKRKRTKLPTFPTKFAKIKIEKDDDHDDHDDDEERQEKLEDAFESYLESKEKIIEKKPKEKDYVVLEVQKETDDINPKTGKPVIERTYERMYK